MLLKAKDPLTKPLMKRADAVHTTKQVHPWTRKNKKMETCPNCKSPISQKWTGCEMCRTPDRQRKALGPSDATACSRSYDDLMESLDDWIDDALKNTKPIGLTLCRARVTIKEQRARIGEVFEALECQNKEVYRLREQVKRLRGALNMWRMEGPDSNACWCDACLAMHGAHPAHSEECNAARDAIDSSENDQGHAAARSGPNPT